MSPATSVYAAHDADEDARSITAQSFSDELSPSDGYINPDTPRPPNVMVIDPQVEHEQAAEAKAREAKEEAERNYKYPSSLVQALSTRSVNNPQSSASTARPRPSGQSSHERASGSSAVPETSSAASQPDTSSLSSHQTTPEHTPDDGPPPPTYAAATANSSPSSPYHESSAVLFPDRNYQTISDHPRDGDAAPDAMGQPEQYTGPEDQQPLLPPQQKKQRRGIVRHFTLKNLLLLLLSMVVASSLLAAITTAPSEPSWSPSDPDAPSDGVPDDDSSPGDDGFRIVPPGRSGHFVPPVVADKAYCAIATRHLFDGKPVSFEMPLGADKSLTLLQKLYHHQHDEYHSSVSTTGRLHVRYLSKDKAHGKAFVTVDAWTSHESLVPTISMRSESEIKISTPSGSDMRNVHHCISLEITLWLPDTTVLSELTVNATTLPIQVFSDVVADVQQLATLNTVSGSIQFPEPHQLEPAYGDVARLAADEGDGWVSEDDVVMSDAAASYLFSPILCVSAVSGSIRGSFHLHDQLSLETISGSISAIITPHEASDDDHLAAVTKLSTKSGSITAYFPIHYSDSSRKGSLPIPFRHYFTTVESASSSIHGGYILGDRASFETASGSIAVELLPLAGLDGRQELVADSRSSSVTVDLLPMYNVVSGSSEPEDVPFVPIGDNDPYLAIPSLPASSVAKALRSLRARISSSSSSVHVQLPSEWEGEIHASSVSSSVTVGGYQVRTEKRGGFINRGATGRKGPDTENASLVDVDTVSGSITVKVLAPEEDLWYNAASLD